MTTHATQSHHPTSTQQRVMTWLERIGAALLGIGFVLFLWVGFETPFKLDAVDIKALAEVAPDAHREALEHELETLEGRWFSDVASFRAAAQRKIAAAAAAANFGDYQRGQYLLATLRVATEGPLAHAASLWLLLTLGVVILGGLLHFIPRVFKEPAGIKNNGITFSGIKSRGYLGVALGLVLIGFYVALYFFPAFISPWIRLVDPISEVLREAPADRWFFYGTLYTLAILVMGVRMAVNYRHSRYHLVRTASVMFFQLGFAFLVPAILVGLNQPSMDLKNAWPLNYTFFYEWNLNTLTSSGAFGWFLLFWGIGLSFLLVPLLGTFVGKRWYCSWVCGCGGLAETMGDPFRHLSDKRLKAWQVERWLVHGVLVFAVVMTALVLSNAISGGAVLGGYTSSIQSIYGFAIGSIFAGVVGTGFYPFMGNRVWCRFGCPLAAILGIVQKYKSRFRITTNGGQCISCGNCSKYCEMGIDVRWYAQRGQNIIRASCVGCGVCAAVCPRGVLRLENGPTDDRYNQTSLVQIAGRRIDG